MPPILVEGAHVRHQEAGYIGRFLGYTYLSNLMEKTRDRCGARIELPDGTVKVASPSSLIKADAAEYARYWASLKPNGRGTVSHFADWVFNVTNPNYRKWKGDLSSAEKLSLGRYAHSSIDRHLAHWMQKVKVLEGRAANWRLLYSDPHDSTATKTFQASRLVVDGAPLRGRPDIVFEDTDTGRILIVERKTTSLPEGGIPHKTWPNLRAQLWCYGWIDDWAAAPEVVLICQFWRKRLEPRAGVRNQDQAFPWSLDYRVRPGWRRNDDAFHIECLRRFLDYAGEFRGS